jgi:hypothetical protein
VVLCSVAVRSAAPCSAAARSAAPCDRTLVVLLLLLLLVVVLLLLLLALVRVRRGATTAAFALFGCQGGSPRHRRPP